jgi:hypothetical protein
LATVGLVGVEGVEERKELELEINEEDRVHPEGEKLVRLKLQ